MNPQLQRIKYLVADYFTALIAWILFFIYRKKFIESEKLGYDIPVEFDKNFLIGIAIVPLIWLLLYKIAGFYHDVYRRSRLNTTGQSILVSLIGAIILFFALMLDDFIADYSSYYKLFAGYFFLHFSISFLARIIILTLATKQIQRGKIGFNTIIIGNGAKAVKIFKDLSTERVSTGHEIIGYCTINGSKTEFKNELNTLGPAENIASLVDQYRIEEIIIAPEKEELKSIEKIISLIHDKNVMIKADPDLKDLLTGSVRLSAIFATPLIEISPMVMPVWQMEIKRIIDILAAILGILFLSPLLLITALIIKSNSPGPIFYAQERIGKWGKPFKILKFRTMFIDAEKFGPALSSKEDPRITSVGKVLRKYRIDELPQLINVLRGEMSLVGPRPERAFFIEQIVINAPHYKLLHRVKPGITSWGMVNYGYAENVEQMIQRLRYDILYLDNMSLVLDFKILIYTILTVIKGRGM